ncbi:acyl-CoA dehydrogenase family protein [Microvirga subterranea]|uniref:Alkylation response protein AidB-like acyl-CoA dehydrogenase n=1 Tax=Microvirga subterranea TaxID=186651 RepID=A0A370HBC0_9HYPH|nr:acyl-CoA dehydrogenase family protein [Microvirga subterranea]RDI53801.1 alkylation response protein AidB-like acyl-CoA dehydrogenase [Microvirga subterranea]
MDFRFSDEQVMTADVVRSLLAEVCNSQDLRRLLTSGSTWDEARWKKLSELGLAGILVPEDNGGLGLAPVDLVQVAEACGYRCLPEPLVDIVGIAIPLLAAFADHPEVAPCLEQAIAGEITVAVSHPVNPYVPHASRAAAALIVRDDGLYLVAISPDMLTMQLSADPFRPLHTIARVPATRIASRDEAEAPLRQTLDRGALFTAAQLLGMAQGCVDLAVGYAKERQQFGRPIGSYQAIKHHLASVQVKIEFARPVVYAAAADLPHDDVYSRARISQAKLAASEAADLAAHAAIQIYGAMGYSWEVDVHLYLKRIIALTQAWGGPSFHRERVAARVFEKPLGPETTFARETDRA